MKKIVPFVFILSIICVNNQAFCEDSYSVTNGYNTINYFNYTSDRCRDINDKAELFQIAVSLRDSKDSKDQIDAVDCMISSAARGYGAAEYELARMYSIGTIIPQNNIFAYKWAQLAILDLYSDAIPLRNKIEAELSTEELEIAFEHVKKIFAERQAMLNSLASKQQTGRNDSRVSVTPLGRNNSNRGTPAMGNPNVGNMPQIPQNTQAINPNNFNYNNSNPALSPYLP